MRVIQIREATEWYPTLMVNNENKKEETKNKMEEKNKDKGFAVWV